MGNVDLEILQTLKELVAEQRKTRLLLENGAANYITPTGRVRLHDLDKGGIPAALVEHKEALQVVKKFRKAQRAGK